MHSVAVLVDTRAAIERLLSSGIGAHRKKTFKLTVRAHHERVPQPDLEATHDVKDDSRIKIERLPRQLGPLQISFMLTCSGKSIQWGSLDQVRAQAFKR